MYEGGRVIDLDTLPGHVSSAAYAINDRNQIVGISTPASYLYGYDPRGLYYRNANGARAFLYDRGKGMVSLGTLRTDAISVPTAINMCGQVVGFSGSPQDDTFTSGLSAFLYAKGRMVDLNSLVANRSAFHLTAATGINDHGQIVGRGSMNGQLHAFLLTPRHRNTDCART